MMGEGDWKYSEMRTTPGEGGPETTAILERLLGEDPMAHGWMLFPEFIMQECWENDGKCLPRQLGACFGKSLEEMEEDFPKPWNAKSVLEYCKSRKISCHI